MIELLFGFNFGVKTNCLAFIKSFVAPSGYVNHILVSFHVLCHPNSISKFALIFVCYLAPPKELYTVMGQLPFQTRTGRFKVKQLTTPTWPTEEVGKCLLPMGSA